MMLCRNIFGVLGPRRIARANIEARFGTRYGQLTMPRRTRDPCNLNRFRRKCGHMARKDICKNEAWYRCRLEVLALIVRVTGGGDVPGNESEVCGKRLVIRAWFIDQISLLERMYAKCS